MMGESPKEEARPVRVDEYYTSVNSMSERYKRTVPTCRFQAAGLDEYMAWKERTRAVLREVTGIAKLQACPPEPRHLGTEELPERSFRRHKLLIRTEPDVWMPMYVLEPKAAANGRRPCIIAAHGHGSGGKLATAAVEGIRDVRQVCERQNYTYGAAFAERGFMVFCPDARGFGERREKAGQGDLPEQYLRSTCAALNHMAISLGMSLTGLWVWDLMRLVDYIQSREDCDPARIGAVGLSGGGLQCLWLAALDERIAATAVSGYFYGYHDALLQLNNNCSCNYVPHLWEHVDMGDIGALVAPRPFVVETGTLDHLNGSRGVENAVEQMRTVRQAYALFGTEQKAVHDIFVGEHRWNGKIATDFIATALNAVDRS